MRNNEKKIINKNSNLDNKNFLTIGSYSSQDKIIKNNEIIRPNLIQINALNETYIKTELKTIKFNSNYFGRFFLKIYLKSVLNDEIKKTLKFNIFLNNKIRKTLEYPIKENFKGNFILLTDLEVNKGDIIYFNYSLKEKIGKLMFEDNIYYEIEFSSINILEYKSSQIIDDSKTINNRGINSLLNEIILKQNKILGFKNKILKLEKRLYNSELPYGTILLSSSAPSYGSWRFIGTLQDGQTISRDGSDGAYIEHNHVWSTGYTAIGNLDKRSSAFSSFDTFNQNSDSFWLGIKRGKLSDTQSFTNKVGSDKNYAYGLGLGKNVNVYYRNKI